MQFTAAFSTLTGNKLSEECFTLPIGKAVQLAFGGLVQRSRIAAQLAIGNEKPAFGSRLVDVEIQAVSICVSTWPRRSDFYCRKRLFRMLAVFLSAVPCHIPTREFTIFASGIRTQSPSMRPSFLSRIATTKKHEDLMNSGWDGILRNRMEHQESGCFLRQAFNPMIDWVVLSIGVPERLSELKRRRDRSCGCKQPALFGRYGAFRFQFPSAPRHR